MLSFCHLEVAFECCDEGDKTVDPAYGYDYEVGKAKPSAWHVSGQVDSDLRTIKEHDVNYIYYSSNADSLPITFTSSGS